MKNEKPLRETDSRRPRPWENRDAASHPDEAGRERRKAEEVDELNRTLQALRRS